MDSQGFHRSNLTIKIAFAVAAAMALVLSSMIPAIAQDVYPPVIPIPAGFQPEGIEVGYGPTFYVGSIPTGAIYRGNLRTGEGEILVQPQEGRMAIGLDFDERTNYLFVAGGPTGQAYVYDAGSGESLADYQLTDAENIFINDVVVTWEAAYFTSSSEPILYRVALGPGGDLLEEPEIQAIELGGEYEQVEGFNANGIVATRNDQWLIIVNSSLGALYRVDPETGNAKKISLFGDSVPNGDGLLLEGRTLYVVQNQLNQIAVVELAPRYSFGKVMTTLVDEDFRVPTTIAQFDRYLYAVNARFGTEPTPETEYEVVQVLKAP
ncbi:MAG: superoxide dismutase [Chloroflexota bacterium]|nr:MAG: superoxide dismutase [Chloroflexota bacterium]